MSWRNLIERLLGPILDYAGDRLADELSRAGNATRPTAAHLTCSVYGEYGASVALGGCATEIPTCCAPRGDWVSGDFKPHHDGRNRT